MTPRPNFRMNEGDDLERLEARLRANARDFARAAGENAVIRVCAGLMREAQARQAKAGVSRR